MTASHERWVCPVCADRFPSLSEFVEHVEARHPADNVTLLEPLGRPTDQEEGDPDVAAGEPESLDREGEGSSAVPTSSGRDAALGLEPFDGFHSAAHAVVEDLARGTDPRVSTLLLRLLGTVLAAEARAEQRVGGNDDPAAQQAGTPIDAGRGPEGHRTWMDMLATEEDRCRRHGMGASVLMVRVGEHEEDVARRAVSVVSRQTRAHDKVVRLRPDALAVLAVHCSEAEVSALVDRVLDAMRTERIPVRTAVGSRGRRLDLYGAWEEAERRLEEPPPPGWASG